MPPRKSKSAKAAADVYEDADADAYDEDDNEYAGVSASATLTSRSRGGGGGGGGGRVGSKRSQGAASSLSASFFNPRGNKGRATAAAAAEDEGDGDEVAEQEEDMGGDEAPPLSMPSVPQGACTSISKLAIMGIRAFSHERESTIEFYKPLTMIVGANGCGKTTIIESLKYVCTGAPPPGGDKGKSFVHDPKLAGVPEVKGSIKLRFKNRAGQDMVVVRSLMLTQKKGSSTFKTLDGVIKSTDPRTGAKTSMSHKCGELDKQVPYLMGVSKAIMENVIFCHQEESSWPLGDPASLKKKFDDIFESSRYSKALETIRKTRLEYANKVKEYKIELAAVDAWREQAETLQADLDKLQSSLSRYEHREEKYRGEIEALEAEIEAYHQAMRKVQDKVVAYQQAEQSLKTKEAVLTEKKGSVEMMEDVDEEGLQAQLEALQKDSSDASAKLAELQSKARRANDKRVKAQFDVNETSMKLGHLRADAARATQDLETRATLGQTLQSKWQLPIAFPATSTVDGEGGRSEKYAEEVATFDQALADVTEGLEQELNTRESEHEASLKEAREAHASSQSELSELTTRSRHDDEAYKRADSEWQKVGLELQGMGRQRATTRQVEEARAAKESKEAEVAAHKATAVEQDFARTLRDVDKKVKENAGDISELREALEAVEGRADEDHKLDLASEAIDEELEELRSRVENRRSFFSEVLEEGEESLDAAMQRAAAGGGDSENDSSSSTDATSKLLQHKAYLKHKREVAQAAAAEAKEKWTNADRASIQAGAILSAAQKQRDQRLGDLKALDAATGTGGGANARFEKLLASINQLRKEEAEEEGAQQEAFVPWTANQKTPEELAAWVDDQIESAKTNLTEAKAEGSIASKLLHKVLHPTDKKKKAKPGAAAAEGGGAGDEGGDKKAVKCAFCRHHLATTPEVDAYVSKLKAMVENANDHELEAEVEKRVALLPLAKACTSDYAQRKELQARLDSAEQECRDLEDELTRLRTVATDAQPIAEQKEGEVAKMSEAERELHKIVDEYSELQRRKSAVVEKRSRLAAAVDPMSASQHLPQTLAGLKKALKDKEEQREELNEELRSLNDKKMKYFQIQSKLETDLHVVRDEFDKLQAAASKIATLDEKRATLRAEMETLDASKASLRKAIAPKQQEVAERLAVCDRLSEAWKQASQHLRSRLTSAQNDLAEFRRLSSVCDQASKLGLEAAAEKMDSEIAELVTRQEMYEKKHAEYESAIAEHNASASEKEMVLFRVKSNLDVLALQRELDHERGEVEVLKEAAKKAKAAAAATRGNQSGGGGSAPRDLPVLEQEKSKLLTDRAENKGKAETMKRQMHDLTTRLKEPNYRGVRERARTKRIEVETTAMACEDLERYWTALDKALLRFHGQKIADINRIIRELWQRTYCGEDIDGIEIVSGEEGGSTRAARSYNYRVVMRKGDALLDMRGRCSAGQRVLACIVIRLALAETFCLSCGILTLDEPTTNLDEYNKAGLATALAEIISTRSKQRNFQLVVITHDADFVTHMRDAFNGLGADRTFNLPEYYWRISRQQTGQNGQYCSEIHRTDWDDM